MKTLVMTCCAAVLFGAVEKPSSRETERGHGWVLYRGKEMPVDKFAKACKEVTADRLKSTRRPLTGSAVKVTGQITRIEEGSLTVLTEETKDGWAGPVVVHLAQIADADVEFRIGLLINVWGIAADKAVIEAWFANLAPPGIEWKYALRPPKGVVGGTVQKFYVDGRVANTGRQPLKSVTVAVRLYQVQSPNDWIETYTITDLDRRKHHDFTVPFELFNFQYIGKTSIPRVEMRVIDYEI